MTLQSYLDTELLRFTTAGSVDDGKSTLIGRLLYDSKAIYEDQLAAVKSFSEKKGSNDLNLALFTDGLRAEREQGITIDVAYRHFSTPKRRFIIADTPGHLQYTRNMVTGASTANAAVILLDVRNGVTEQTIRHTFIASLLQIPHIIVCVNKMDLVGYSEDVFEKIKHDFVAFASKMDIQDVQFIPISALYGDNIVRRSAHTDWYGGATLIYMLENIHIGSDQNHIDTRFPVQLVISRQNSGNKHFRGYAGKLAGGILKPGDRVKILPSGMVSRIKTLEIDGRELAMVYAPQSCIITLDDEIDISRGDMIVRENNVPDMERNIDLMVCWLNEQPLNAGVRYQVKHTTRDVKCMVKEIVYKIDIRTLERNNADKTLLMNDIARLRIHTSAPLFVDPYRRNRNTGGLILIDEKTNETVCAGMVV